MQEIDDELKRLDALKEEELPEEIFHYYCFLFRRRAHVLTDMHHLDEAEKLLKNLIELGDQSKLIRHELDYIKQLRKMQQENS